MIRGTQRVAHVGDEKIAAGGKYDAEVGFTAACLS